jgi:hypothetical protein
VSVLVCGLIATIVLLAAAMMSVQAWLADRRYQAAAAEVEILDPAWRLDRLLADQHPVSDQASSTVRVQSIVARLPKGWPGIEQFDPSFVPDGGTPDVRLSKGRIAQLSAELEPVAEFASQARELAEFPSGNLIGPRPKFERFEQVGGLNAYVNVAFPYGDEVRRVVFLLWLDAKLNIDAGDFETAVVDVRAMLNAGRSVGDYPGVSAQMTRVSALSSAIPCLEAALAQGEVRRSSLAALGSLLEDESQFPHLAVALRGERAIADDLLEQIHAGKADNDAIPGLSDYPSWMRLLSGGSNLREIQADLLSYHTRAVQAGLESEEERIDAMQLVTDGWVRRARSWRFLDDLRHLPERLLLGRVAGAPIWIAIDQGLMRTAIAALAAERYRLDVGRWPESLDQLVPRYMGAVPADPLGRGPLKLRRFRDGLFVYSVGFDRRDDGGKIDWQIRQNVNADSGFRLWDVARRRRPANGKVAGPDNQADDSTSRTSGPQICR